MYLARFTPKSGADWYRDVTKIWLRKKTLVIRKLPSPRGPGVGLKEDKQSLYPFFQNGAREISCEIVPMYSIDTQHEKAPRFREL